MSVWILTKDGEEIDRFPDESFTKEQLAQYTDSFVWGWELKNPENSREGFKRGICRRNASEYVVELREEVHA